MTSIIKRRKIMNYFKKKQKLEPNRKINLLLAKNELKLSRNDIYYTAKYYEKKGRLTYYPPFKEDTVDKDYAQDFVMIIDKPKKKFLSQSNKDAIKVAVIGGIILYILQYWLKPLLEYLKSFLGF